MEKGHKSFNCSFSKNGEIRDVMLNEKMKLEIEKARDENLKKGQPKLEM